MALSHGVYHSAFCILRMCLVLIWRVFGKPVFKTILQIPHTRKHNKRKNGRKYSDCVHSKPYCYPHRLRSEACRGRRTVKCIVTKNDCPPPKPMPVTIAAAICMGRKLTTPRYALSTKFPVTIKRHAPKLTKPNVRVPADCFAITARSVPITPPRIMANKSLPNITIVGSMNCAAVYILKLFYQIPHNCLASSKTNGMRSGFTPYPSRRCGACTCLHKTIF